MYFSARGESTIFQMSGLILVTRFCSSYQNFLLESVWTLSFVKVVALQPCSYLWGHGRPCRTRMDTNGHEWTRAKKRKKSSQIMSVRARSCLRTRLPGSRVHCLPVSLSQSRTDTNGHERTRTDTNGHKRTLTDTNGLKRTRTDTNRLVHTKVKLLMYDYIWLCMMMYDDMWWRKMMCDDVWCCMMLYNETEK